MMSIGYDPEAKLSPKAFVQSYVCQHSTINILIALLALAQPYEYQYSTNHQRSYLKCLCCVHPILCELAVYTTGSLVHCRVGRQPWAVAARRVAVIVCSRLSH